MLNIRRAGPKDEPAILDLVKLLDLAYPAQSFKNFRVAEANDEIVGLADLEEFADFFFLSSVGVAEKSQKQGIATALLKKILTGLKKDVYLYTTLPDFFRRFGFNIVSTWPPYLPPKETFSCRECTPETCVCMVKKP